MKPQPIRYAVVRFQPYVETEEFANVGIVMVVPYSGYFDFLIETRRIARYTSFFDEIDRRAIRTLLGNCRRELERIKDLAGYDAGGQQRLELWQHERADQLFAALTKDREGIINYSDVRLAFHPDPRKLLKELFDRYVGRSFPDHERNEARMEQALRKAMLRSSFSGRLRPRRYDDGLYFARFPFVGYKGEEQAIALKPLFLGQSEPNRILEHANKWRFAVNRLRAQLPEQVTFVVEGPSGEGVRARAFREATSLLGDTGALVIDDETEAMNAITSRLQ